MRLTREEHGERLERFGHLDRASRFGGRRCGDPLPASSRRCTRPRGHRGPHAVHGALGRVVAVWEEDAPELRPSDEARATPARVRRDRAVRAEPSPGILARTWKRVVKILSSPEELALILLFLGLVAWGIDVALRILVRW